MEDIRVNVQNMSDHDLLIRLDQKVENLTNEVRSSSDNFRIRVRTLETQVDSLNILSNKVDPIVLSKDVRLLEDRLNAYENKGRGVWIAVGVSATILGSILSFLWPIILSSLKMG